MATAFYARAVFSLSQFVLLQALDSNRLVSGADIAAASEAEAYQGYAAILSSGDTNVRQKDLDST